MDYLHKSNAPVCSFNDIRNKILIQALKEDAYIKFNTETEPIYQPVNKQVMLCLEIFQSLLADSELEMYNQQPILWECTSSMIYCKGIR